MRIKENEVTPYQVYLSRRTFMAGAVAFALAPGAGEAATPPAGQALKGEPNPAYRLADSPTPLKDVSSYNNFYEFGVNKDDPARLAHTLKPRPWTVAVDGLCAKPKSFDVDEIMRMAPLEERVYSLRYVEGWSMVIPWIGFPLAALLKRAEPTSQAK